MARTTRTVPHHAQGSNDWAPAWHNTRGQKVSEKYERGLVHHEICTDFRAGRLDNWSTATTGGKSTRRIKQIAGKQRRAHEKREAQEVVDEC
jgi:hypothetical protein